jgi:hypothetical protein
MECPLAAALVPYGTVAVLAFVPVHLVVSAVVLCRGFGLTPSCLPSYFPDFNPIDAVSNATKQWLRRVQSTTCEHLEASCRRSDAVTTNHARNCARHSGYSLA